MKKEIKKGIEEKLFSFFSTLFLYLQSICSSKIFKRAKGFVINFTRDISCYLFKNPLLLFQNVKTHNNFYM